MSVLQLTDHLREASVVQVRVVVAAACVVLLSAALLARLYYLEVVEHDRYATLSQDNRIDVIAVPPVRGMIFDRHGAVLADNYPVYNLVVTPDKVDDVERLVDELSRLIHLPDADLERFRRALARRPGFEQQILRSNLSESDAARFAVNQHRYPGVNLKAALFREYPLGELTGHVVGYVGRISERDLGRIDRTRYRGTEFIGKLGIEAHYEHLLLGQPGVENVETNAHGRRVRSLTRTSAIAGANLHLTLDVRLQEVARQALGDFKGSIVAIEPATGDVLAFVSAPGYDPNPFVTGIDQASYDVLRLDPDRPLLNRALHGRYAPGSTIKGFMGLMALDAGIDPNHRTFCPGWFSLPNSAHRYRDWRKGGHGSLSMTGAIEQSCDVYFYRLAHQLGIDRMHDMMTRFGFGRKTGIDLDDEASGLMPSREWKRGVRNEPWYPGETVIAGIGQGYMLVTPLQLAAVTAMLANRGRVVRPRLLRAVEDAETQSLEALALEETEPLPLTNSDYFEKIIGAMEDVVHGSRGTARQMGKDLTYRMAGKTGTAQVIGIAQNEKYDESKIEERFRDHALFIAFAPVDQPLIAIAVVAENGGGGSRTAAPMARKVIDYFMTGQHPRA